MKARFIIGFLASLIAGTAAAQTTCADGSTEERLVCLGGQSAANSGAIEQNANAIGSNASQIHSLANRIGEHTDWIYEVEEAATGVTRILPAQFYEYRSDTTIWWVYTGQEWECPTILAAFIIDADADEGTGVRLAAMQYQINSAGNRLCQATLNIDSGYEGVVIGPVSSTSIPAGWAVHETGLSHLLW